MPLEDDIKTLSERIPELLNMRLNEAQTNQYLVEPFIEALGYRLSDHTQVERESTADFGKRQSYKVDYAIKSEGVPIIVIECKKVSETLGGHFDQLKGYFSATVAELAKAGPRKGLIGVLTNGLTYQFFTDQEEPNIMDPRPFWQIDVRSLDSKALQQLEKFEKGNFDAVEAFKGASELNYINSIKDRLALQLETPDDGFVDFFGRDLHSGGNYTQVIRDSFRDLVHNAFKEFVGEQILRNAERGAEFLNTRPTPPTEELSDETTAESLDDVAENNTKTSQASEPTDEERQAYEIVKTIVSEVVDTARVIIRDNQSYCPIFLDNNTMPLCRFYFDHQRKRIGLFDGRRNSQNSLLATMYDIQSVHDIHNHADQLRETAQRYLES